MRKRLSEGALRMTREWFGGAAATARTQAVLKEAHEEALRLAAVRRKRRTDAS
jgi:hypothetical protein